MCFYINIYSISRAYGGPEEGGWWYDVGEFMTCSGPFSKKKALAKAVKENLRLQDQFENSDLSPHQNFFDKIEARVEDHVGRDFPDDKPSYE